MLRDACTYAPPKELGVLFAEDIIAPDALKLQCLYRRFDSLDGKVSINVLNNAAVVLRGKARLTQFVSLPTALLTRLGPVSIPPRPMVTAWQAVSLSQRDSAGNARILDQLDNQTFKPAVDVSTGDVTVTNEAVLASALADMLDSIYLISIQGQNGLFVQNAVGPPYGGDCPLKKVVMQ